MQNLFFTVQTETFYGPEFYRTYTRKRYAETVFAREVARLEQEGRAGAVTLYDTHEFVREHVTEGGQ